MNGKAAAVKSVAVCPLSCPFAQTKIALGAVCGGENNGYRDRAGRAPGLKMLKKSVLTIGHFDDGEEGVGTCPLTLALSPMGGREGGSSIPGVVERRKGRDT